MADSSRPWDRVRGMVPVSLCDWPGKVSCVLFAAGCNFRCPTCHNAALAWKWKTLQVLDRKTVLDDLRRRKRWLDGITLSGGEPTCVEGLEGLLEDLAGVGLPVKIDSNGWAPEILARLLADGLVRTVAVDVKGPWRMYPGLTGNCMSPEAARDCLERVFALAGEYAGQVYFRCTKVPALSDEDLAETRSQVPEELGLHFQDYVPPRVCDEAS